jgi:hypothetical protein
MIVFLLGAVWFFLLSMQTRVIAHANNYAFHAVLTFGISVLWVILIKQLTENASANDCFWYAAGTALGSVIATYVHTKLFKKP